MSSIYNLVADVSSNNPDTPAYFRQLARGGCRAVIVKLTQGSNPGTAYKNPKAANQIKNAMAAGMLVHAYHYASFISPADARNEADWFVSAAQHHQIGTQSVMMLDVESTVIPQNATPCANAFIERVQELGYPRTDVYAMASWYWEHRLDKDQLKAKNRMVARYRASQPGVTNTGTWQFTRTWNGMQQDMSYDFFGYYTEPVGSQGFQLELDSVYYIKPGDSWWLVAHQHGLDMHKLAEMNDTDISTVLHPGRKLIVG